MLFRSVSQSRYAQVWEYEKEGMGLQYNYGQQAADAEYKRNLQMWKDTNFGAQRAEMEDAGLSVGLMYGNGGGQAASTAGGNATQPNAPKTNPVEVALQQQALGLQLKQIEAQNKLANAETAKTLAEANKIAGVDTEIEGKVAFTLYDTFGFPLDLTELILRENSFTVNIDEFNAEMQKQKERARNAAAIETGDWVTVREGDSVFVGYDFTEADTEILRYRKVKQKNQEYYQLVLSKTPFYAEMGGQVGDCGVLKSDNETIEIIDTKKENNLAVHIAKNLPTDVTEVFTAVIDVEKRKATECNHSATHRIS